MTIPNHIAQGATLAHILTKTLQTWEMVLICAVAGIWFALPDLRALPETIHGRWEKYNELHIPTWYNFNHTYPDLLVHSKDGGMNKWYVPVEVTLWILMIFYWWTNV